MCFPEVKKLQKRDGTLLQVTQVDIGGPLTVLREMYSLKIHLNFIRNKQEMLK